MDMVADAEEHWKCLSRASGFLRMAEARRIASLQENWVIIANNYFGENFMCGAASATAPGSNNDKFRSLSKKRAYEHVSI
jgi:hypothetical protein